MESGFPLHSQNTNTNRIHKNTPKSWDAAVAPAASDAMNEGDVTSHKASQYLGVDVIHIGTNICLDLCRYHIYIYIYLYWVWPMPSNSGKSRFTGIPYKKWNTHCGLCYWEEPHPIYVSVTAISLCELPL